MERKITLLDGAQGTRLWTLAEQNGIAREPVWKYNLTHPEFVAQVCREYAEAGAEIICANTFGANRPALEKFPDFEVAQVVGEAVRIAKDTLDGAGIRVALDIGPLPVLMEPYGDLEEDEAEEIFGEIVDAGVDAGADFVFFETFLDVEMMRVAVQAAKKHPTPVICSMSFEKSGRTMMGNTVENIVETLSPLGIEGIGMNCSLGPDLSLPVIREFAERTDLPLFFKPNAGMPAPGADGAVRYDCTPERFAEETAPALPLIRYLGGCCGTDAEYIRRLKRLLEQDA